MILITICKYCIILFLLQTQAILLVSQLHIPYLKFYLDNTARFQTRHTMKFQFPFRVFYVLSVFSRPAMVLNLDLFTSVTEYGMKSSLKVRDDC